MSAAPPEPEAHRQRVEVLRLALDARAAGLWDVREDRLELVAFAPAPDLPAEVARSFVAATRSVERTRADLGITRAATAGAVAVSIVARLSAEAGSGHWLRAFGALRSVAVPLDGPDGRVAAVLSVALAENPLDDQAIARLVRASEVNPAPGLDRGAAAPDNS